LDHSPKLFLFPHRLNAFGAGLHSFARG